MNHSIDNDISALMDDELPPDARDELYQVIKSDAVLVEKWSRYHLIRDALTNQLPDSFSLDFAERVKEAIDAEPTHFLPQNRRENAAALPAGEDNRPHRPRWLMPAAAAATVAAVAILGFQLDRGGETAPALTASSSPVSSLSPQTLVSSQDHLNSGAPQWWRGQTPPSGDVLARHLAQGAPTASVREAADRYLVDHNGVAAGSGVYNVFPYARLVSQDPAGVR